MAELGGAGGPHARYFNSDALSDITIHFSGRQIKAHKIVLASQSEHFRAMFEGGFAEATARDVHLHEDNPEAMHGALAWCYGLQYDGKTTLDRSATDPIKYSGDEQYHSYLINLYATGGKYVMPELQARTEEQYNAEMNGINPRWVPLIQRDRAETPSRDVFMYMFEESATLLYLTHGECTKALRPSFVKAIWALAPALKVSGKYKQLMMDVPELAVDMLDLAMAEKEDAKQG